MTCILFFCYSASMLTAANWYPKSLPCDVSVGRNGTTVLVECNERRLIEVPKGFPANVTNLTLTINHIPNIYKTSFAGLENITEIDFRCNCMPVKIGPKDHVCTKSLHVEDGSFSSLPNLRSLYLDGNQLSKIPKGLPPNLLLLSLEVNKFSAIYKENLSELTNIEKLYLGQNCYYRNPCNVSFDIQYGAFYGLNNLTLLSLKSNNLSQVPQNLPPSLKELYLYNNRIQHIARYDFINLTQLEILDLSGNCPRCYNAPFPCTPCPNNAQINIDLFAFDTLKDLKILRLHSNSLETVPYQWFQHTGMLKILDLSSNYLAKEIERAQFLTNLSKLEEIDLSFNFELKQYLPFLSLSKTFCNLISLRVLRIRGYVFRELNEAAFEPLKRLKQLEIIDLGTNFIKLANLSILRELKAFEIINLSDNKISPYSNDSPYISRSCSTANTNRAPLGSRTQIYHGEVQDIHYFRYDEYARSCKSKDKEAGSLSPIVNKDCSRFGKTLDLSRNNIFFINPTEFKYLGNLRCLNLSGNAMSQSLNGSEFSYLSELEYLDFSNNRIDLMYSTAFQELKNLKVLDLSHNNFYFLSEGITHMLNFTKNLPKLQTLLLNYNKISTSTNTVMESHSLEILEFKGNRLDVLWRDGDTSLKYLDLSFNQLQFIMKSSFPENVVNRLEVLLLNGNKFKCTCENLWFVMWVNQTTVHIPRLATDVTCAAPGAQKGRSVLFVDLHTCQLNSLSIILHILSTSIILCLLVISILSHLFYWDVWYSYHFCAAKLKGYQTLSSQSSCYDAYIVYDKKDSAVSDWVLNELRVHMEDKGDTCFHLCLDERDWILGLPIIDNLSQSIQQSRKTVFVLTNTFLSSGHFKTAFYLAHQLLMDDKSDVIILVFLERSLQSSKYLRLRKRLCSGSVLEWPKNPQAQRYFWQCLRNALATENHTQYNKLFRETL
ncbi:TLR7 protein, partial [Polyodon spathula]|nr:TLR7 protein [Polyodon spathula]